MSRPKSPADFQMVTCYIPKKDLARVRKLAKKQMSSMSAIVRQAVATGLTRLESRN